METCDADTAKDTAAEDVQEVDEEAAGGAAEPDEREEVHFSSAIMGKSKCLRCALE